MKKVLVVLLASAFALGSVAAMADDKAPPQPVDQAKLKAERDKAKAYTARRIDLDVPANLEAIERDHPEHYAKIQRILSEVRHQPTGTVATWMRTQFDAQDVSYIDLIKTSLPPKKRLEFRLDRTTYVALITLWTPELRGTPAK
jgi:hypothetical protein